MVTVQGHMSRRPKNVFICKTLVKKELKDGSVWSAITRIQPATVTGCSTSRATIGRAAHYLCVSCPAPC